MTAWQKRGLFAASFLGLSIAVSIGAWLAGDSVDREASEPDIREAVFRYQFQNNASAAQQDVDYYFLSIRTQDGYRDPSPALLARFEDQGAPDVAPGSKAEAPRPGGGLQHKDDGGSGLRFNVHEKVRWLDDEAVKVRGGYYEASLSSAVSTYRVERRNSEWVVTDQKLEAISDRGGRAAHLTSCCGGRWSDQPSWLDEPRSVVDA